MFDHLDPAVTADSREVELVAIEAMINRLRHRQAELIRRADVDQTTRADGCRTLAEWVAGRLDIDRRTARDLVGVARDGHAADGSHPVSGSFARTVATRRLVAAGASEATVRMAEGMDIAAIDRVAARHRRITRAMEQEASSGRYLVLQPSLDQTRWSLHGQLDGVDGAAVSTVLDAAAEAMPTLPDGTREPRTVRRADALVQRLTSPASCTEASPTKTTVTVFVDACEGRAADSGQTGAWIVGGPRVGPSTLERLLCEGTIDVIAHPRDGTPLTVGTAQTAIAPATRRHVLHRDGGVCTADGCTSRYRLQPHHIHPRAAGGTNHPDNLTSLCWFHHHVVVHRHGYTIDPTTPPQRRRFLQPAERGPPP